MATAAGLEKYDQIRGPIRALRVVQDIFDVRIQPTPEAVDVDFTLAHGVQPLVEVFAAPTGRATQDMVPANRRGVAFSFYPRSKHRLRVHNLQQNTRYWLQITAADVVPGRPPAVRVGRFVTARRSLTIVPHDVAVFLDGDPASCGDMWFEFAVYESAGPRIGGSLRYPASGEETICDGKIVSLRGGRIDIARAPSEIALLVQGYDDDASIVCWGPLPLMGRGVPDQDPLGPSHGETCDFAFANAYQRVQLPEAVGPFSDRQILDSGRWAVHYKATILLSGDITLAAPPVMFSTGSTPGGARSGRDAAMARAVGPGAPATVAWHGRSVTFCLGPEGALYQLLSTGRRGERRWSSWVPLNRRLRGGLTARAMTDGVHLLGVDEGGSVVHAVVGDRPELGRPPSWLELGSGFVAADTALAEGSEEVLHVLALGVDGHVRHLQLAPTGGMPTHSDWTDLGGGVEGPVAGGITASDDGLVVAGRSGGGLVWRRWRPGCPGDGDARWHELGGEVGPPIVVPAAGGIDVAVIGSDRCLRMKHWDGTGFDPPGPRWTLLGCLDGPDPASLTWGEPPAAADSPGVPPL